MCLTIPAKVISLHGDKAIVQDSTSTQEVETPLLKDLKVGDWILYTNRLAVKKISREDAQEIIDLLETKKEIDISKVSERFRQIVEATKKRELTEEEITYLLETEGVEKEALLVEADVLRKTYLKDFICIHGIIEFSNYCKNDCYYCGLRRDNKELKRYRMSVDEIVQTADEAVNKKGYKLLVLQSGEDYFYTPEKLEEIVRRIKECCRVFLILSIGERDYDTYKRLKEAGASGVLFRFETSSPGLFKLLHPKGKSLEKRWEHLKFLKELKYYIATGSLIGLPSQTTLDLAKDVLMMKKWANMISMGPFVPCENTPLSHLPSGSVEMNLKMIAILRLLMKNARIPVVTALETLAGEDGRIKTLQSGANSLMFNLTPMKYRSLYHIYPNRFYQSENKWEKYGLFKMEESYKMLEERMQLEIEVKQ